MNKADHTNASQCRSVNSAAGPYMNRLLVIEGQPSLLKGLCMLLDAQPDMRIVGEASELEAAVSLALSLSPDVILVAMGTLTVDGIAMAGALHAVCPQVPIIVLSLRDDALTQCDAKNAGAAAFVPQSSPVEALLSTIRQVA